MTKEAKTYIKIFYCLRKKITKKIYCNNEENDRYVEFTAIKGKENKFAGYALFAYPFSKSGGLKAMQFDEYLKRFL